MKIKIEENLCIIKPPVTHSTVQCENLYSVWTAIALLRFCTYALLRFCTYALMHCTFKQLHNICTTICSYGGWSFEWKRKCLVFKRGKNMHIHLHISTTDAVQMYKSTCQSMISRPRRSCLIDVEGGQERGFSRWESSLSECDELRNLKVKKCHIFICICICICKLIIVNVMSCEIWK